MEAETSGEKTREELRAALRAKIHGKRGSRGKGAGDVQRRKAEAAAQTLALESGDAQVLQLVQNLLQNPKAAAKMSKAAAAAPRAAATGDEESDEEAPPA